MATSLADFTPIAEEFYPGTTKPLIRQHVETPRKTSIGMDPYWDMAPRHYPVAGVETEFFTIGHLAKALGRRPGTIRLWEREGVLPKATFRVPSETKYGTRRLYSREQIEGLVKLAFAEDILVSHTRPISETDFTIRALQLFNDLAASTGDTNAC